MGGQGSGNWYRWGGKKATAEESLSLGMREFRGRIHPHSSGKFTWTRAGKVTASVGYLVAWDPGPTLTLHYRQGETDVRTPIRLDVTYPALGGVRWWFACPYIVNGVACNRRVGKLFLPPGARFFGCRRCHNLTYESSQEAHNMQRLVAGLGYDPNVARLIASRWKDK
ncbi:MAG: hypothetical protein ABSG53_00565 [Thermoguttaceae bacterium]